ncbi:MAG: heme-binding protein [Planctomycetota bacterium]|jgi:putative heme-binding domain-containing protein|nr:heme-binding protein [Planctomycetota bacterium]MDP6762301.1 heme-binding protein [Planctomycetota bacterium]MDP6990311.1 heme-binding protein [Planctomycetota bacterium]
MSAALAVCALPLALYQDAAPPAEPAEVVEVVEAGEAQWIWASSRPGEEETAWVHRTFELPDEAQSATLWGACDNLLAVYLNGRHVAEGRDWNRPILVDVAGVLRAGTNTVTALCRNSGGPAAVVMRIEASAGGAEFELVTDESWLASTEEVTGWTTADFRPTDWGGAYVFGPVGMAPWGDLPGGEGGEPQRALAAEELTLLPGFEAELLYSVPRALQDSWVSMTVDAEGHLIVSAQYGALYRVVPPPAGCTDPPVVSEIPVQLGHAQGLLCAFGSLYAVVSHSDTFTGGLYRVRDTDGDDEYDTVELLRALDGGGEHGPHAVRLGPDGESLYVIAGNHTALPEVDESRVPRVWGEDQLLPRKPDPNGHAVGVLAPGGWVCRTDPDGKSWELVACGMRNAYDMDFDAEGELLTFDSDMEWDIGLPWYRPTRVLHLVSGAEFGWRHGSGKWPVHYPDSLPGAVDIGLSSPTGVVFGTRSAFPPRYQRALFVADWAYGTMYAVHLAPRGSSFTGTAEAFVTGKPLPLCDMEFGADGALYFIVGGRRTQSGLYRVRWTGGEVAGADAVEAGAAVRAGAEARAERRSVEACFSFGEARAFEGVWNALASPDPFLRHAARVGLEHRDPSEWAERVLAEERPRVVIQGIVALARTQGADAAALLAALERLEVAELSREDLLDALRAWSLVFIRSGAPPDGRRRALVHKLEGLFPAGDIGLDRELCRVLVYLGSQAVIPRTLELIEASASEADQLHYAFLLRGVADGWTPRDRQRYFAWIGRAVSAMTGGVSFEKYVRGLRDEALALLDEEERAAVTPLLAAPPSPQASDGQQPPEAGAPAPIVHRWTLDELAGELGSLARGRDFPAGEAAYRRATCHVCHRMAGEGGSTGSDLTGAGSRFSPRDLLEAILTPSAAISDQYQDTEVWTTDDELFVGRIEDETEEHLVIRTAPPREEVWEIPVGQVALRRLHPISRMPEGLLDTLDLEQVLDLLAYVLSGADPAAPAFGDGER